MLNVAILLAFSAGIAQAEPPQLVSYGSFGTGEVLADGVVVDQPSGDVYVANFVNSAFSQAAYVNKFDPEGKLLPPSPFAQGLDAGAAVNPTNGELYVLGGVGTIETYDPNTGERLSSFRVSPSHNFFFGHFTVVQIAADSAGNVYVPVVPENEVLEYSPNGMLLQTFTGSPQEPLKGPTGVAVDSSGNVWVADNGNNRIEELSSSNVPMGEIKSEGVEAVALDGHSDVFAIVTNGVDFCGSLTPPCSHLVEYSSAGAQLADVGAGSFGASGARIQVPKMVAVNQASDRVYVTDSGKERVWIFGPPKAPAVERELAAEVRTSEAKLGALVNPGGIQTTYRFEYGATAAYGQSTPFPEGSVGEGITAHAVWAAASGLAPGTTYHYRVVATNELGPAYGADQAFTTETTAQAACPNEQLRSGFSAALPDCRAYELVTPPTKTSVQFDSRDGGGSQAARDGDRVSFTTQEPLPGAPAGGGDYLATRGADGWISEDMIPLRSYTAVKCNEESGFVDSYAAEMSSAVVLVGYGTRASTENGSTGACNGEGVETVKGEPLGYENLLRRDNSTGEYRLVNNLDSAPLGATPEDAHFRGASPDLSHVVFSERAQLTPDAPLGVEDLYEWDEGALRLVTVLPDGTPVGGSLPAAQDGLNRGHAVSSDGSRIAFTADGNLYVRLHGSSTLQLDASQAGGTGGGGTFWAASADGSRVFFTDENRLTADSTAESGRPDLYECEIVEEGPACRLIDLTVAEVGAHASVLRVVAVSEDGSYVYFWAEGKLAPGATEGQMNVYLRHAGSTTFIATLDPNDGGFGPATAASPDGAWLAFASYNSLTGYHNAEPSGRRVEEVFVYDAASGSLVCASCNPSGEAPVAGGGATLRTGSGFARFLSDSGRLFFNTRDPLVPTDTNGQIDVYEYEGGEPRLISAGTSANESLFLDASEGGDNVFFFTRQRLVPQDTEEEGRVIYDARVDGGFPAASSPPPCVTADACRTPVSPQPPIYGAPSSQTFSGAGNLASPAKAAPKKKAKPKKCRKGYVKRKGRCVRRKAHGKARKRNHRGRR